MMNERPSLCGLPGGFLWIAPGDCESKRAGELLAKAGKQSLPGGRQRFYMLKVRMQSVRSARVTSRSVQLRRADVIAQRIALGQQQSSWLPLWLRPFWAARINWQKQAPSETAETSEPNGDKKTPGRRKEQLALAGLLQPTSNIAEKATYNSKSVIRVESRNPLANGFESILSFVIYMRFAVGGWFELAAAAAGLQVFVECKCCNCAVVLTLWFW